MNLFDSHSHYNDKKFDIDVLNKNEVYNFISSKENPLYLCGLLVKEKGFQKYFPQSRCFLFATNIFFAE